MKAIVKNISAVQLQKKPIKLVSNGFSCDGNSRDLWPCGRNTRS